MNIELQFTHTHWTRVQRWLGNAPGHSGIRNLPERLGIWIWDLVVSSSGPGGSRRDVPDLIFTWNFCARGQDLSSSSLFMNINAVVFVVVVVWLFVRLLRL